MLFQSTHSLRSATPWPSTSFPGKYVSIHALLAECDVKPYGIPEANPSFNPRTPCGVRHGASLVRVQHVSFNPRTPCGVRRLPNSRISFSSMFQSTHSLRSATYGLESIPAALFVSIHALLAECDNGEPRFCSSLRGFNPRTPCGVRLRLTIYIVIQQRKRYFAPTSRRRPSSPSLLF